VEIVTPSCALRPFRPSDRDRLAAIADDQRIARNMTMDFPHPYTVEDAESWIARCLTQIGRPEHVAIEVDGELSGGIGLERGSGVRHHVATFGYWLEPSVWGRGIATDAAGAFLDYAFDFAGLERIQATVFGWNPASARVLHKCGFTLEGMARESIFRFGESTDELLFGLLRSEWLMQRSEG
jgi:RimJ/RimL family protein N-acetyltransferase